MYKWLKNGVSLGDYSSELFHKIHNTQREDAGAYQCIAKNDVGAIFSEKNNIVVACKFIFALKTYALLCNCVILGTVLTCCRKK